MKNKTKSQVMSKQQMLAALELLGISQRGLAEDLGKHYQHIWNAINLPSDPSLKAEITDYLKSKLAEVVA